MARDYANRAKMAVRRQGKPRPRVVAPWVIVIGLFVIFTLLLVAVGHKRGPSRAVPEPVVTTPQVAVKVAKKQPTQQGDIKEALPKFDFYTMLPRKEPRSLVTYELELATLSSHTGAENLKARLALLGFVANITPIRAHRYQVSIGPYDNKNDALADGKRLVKHNFKNKLKRVV